MAKKPNPFAKKPGSSAYEKADEAMDKKMGVKENSAKDTMMDAKAMAKGRGGKTPLPFGPKKAPAKKKK